VKDGRVLLNGKRLRLRGASIHEDDPAVGAAWGPSHRRSSLRQLRRVGASVARAHYPLHPATLESFDRAGILYWAQAPVYQLNNAKLQSGVVRRRALSTVKETVKENINHASVFVWSVANELGSDRAERGSIGPGHARFMSAAQRAVRRLDPANFVGIDRHNRRGEPQGHPVVKRFDVLGMNEYFGWYESALPGAPPTSTSELLTHLDTVHAAYPRMPMVITEFGAEAFKQGPAAEKGTFEFQRKWTSDHLLIHGARPFVNGSIVWALRDFRVHPEWNGGAPGYKGAWHNKSLIEENGVPKPVFYDTQTAFRRVRPLGR